MAPVSGHTLQETWGREHTRFFQQMPKPWQDYLLPLKSREHKSALQLLDEMVKNGNDALCVDALALATQNGRTDADSIRQCYYMISRKEHRPDPLTLISPAPALNYNPSLSVYDNLMGGGINV